jgi:hypothetical protein
MRVLARGSEPIGALNAACAQMEPSLGFHMRDEPTDLGAQQFTEQRNTVEKRLSNSPAGVRQSDRRRSSTCSPDLGVSSPKPTAAVEKALSRYQDQILHGPISILTKKTHAGAARRCTRAEALPIMFRLPVAVGTSCTTWANPVPGTPNLEASSRSQSTLLFRCVRAWTLCQSSKSSEKRLNSWSWPSSINELRPLNNLAAESGIVVALPVKADQRRAGLMIDLASTSTTG